MNNVEREKIIRVLKVLLVIDDPEIIRFTIESLIEELEEATSKKGGTSDT
ncbi:MAG TPA: hypothetical protein VI423_04880 [Paenisporosarcina sp.]|nr:hypothetical protein [Paenisporosarcina sp.]